ncbi:hypothetical protein [Nocardia sp. GAS34]|uniref:hypothetical protein n=1 Tax=unclassified Nocardia TaxID=2637762 RepID=UPI003D1FA8FC
MGWLDQHGIEVPNLVAGERDQPVGECFQLALTGGEDGQEGVGEQEILFGRPEVYDNAPHGLHLTHGDRLTADLLDFIKN